MLTLPAVSFTPGVAWSADDGLILEEVMVTARKREESLVNAPLAVSVVSGSEMESQGVTGLEQLSAKVPSLQVGRGAQASSIYIRGIGSGINKGFEQSVGMYIDGIYQSRSLQFTQSIFDLARVEVLRGPQGVLFGKNAVAGAIKIETAGPQQGDGFRGTVSALWEPEYNTQRYSLALSGDLSETLAARFVYSDSSSDGYVRNKARNTDERQDEDRAARLTLAWAPTDTLSVTGKVSYSEMEAYGAEVVIADINYGVIPGYLALGKTTAVLGSLILSNGLEPNFGLSRGWESYTNNRFWRPQDVETSESTNVSLNVEWNVGDFVFTSLSGFTNFETDNDHDVDFTPVNLAHTIEGEKLEQFSQEFRLASDWDGPVNVVLGAYYEKQRLKIQNENQLDGTMGGLISPLIGGAPTLFHASVLAASNPAVTALINAGLLTPTTQLNSVDRRYTLKQTAETKAIFGEVEYEFTDRWALELGLRYSEDEKDVVKDNIIGTGQPGQFVPLLNPADTVGSASLNQLLARAYAAGGPQAVLAQVVWGGLVTYPHLQDLNSAEEHLDAAAKLRWEYSDTGMTYLSFSQGYKSGGFNATPDSARPDGTPSTGTEFKDESVDAWELGVKQSLFNGRARIGAAVYRSELENLQVTSFNGINFVVGNAAELVVQGVELESQWKATGELEFGLSLNYLDHKYASFPGAPCTIAEGALVAVCTKDLTGKRGAYAPEWTGAFYVDYVKSVGANWDLFAHVDVNYKADMYLGNDLDEALHQDAYVKVDSRIGVMSVDGTWSVSVFGRNLTDKRTFTTGLDAPLTGGIKAAWVEEPRVLGVQGTYRF
ncbi:TonB-dependent receptor [Povalibacter sp.]|uniref:TonB-dependent receptor n=1 Tax=Povalibacter sp. TaxID=1962978 RepID=UPI002F420175